jgi:translation initiation factor IF-1
MNVRSEPSEGEAEGPVREKATVLEALPNALFRLRKSDGTTIVGHVAGDLRMAFARLLPGDVVDVEVSPLDRNRARIARRSG